MGSSGVSVSKILECNSQLTSPDLVVREVRRSYVESSSKCSPLIPFNFKYPYQFVGFRRTVPAVDDSGALSWDQVKDAGKKTFQGVSSFVQEAAPYIVDGIHIAQAIKGKSATPPRELLYVQRSVS